MAPARAEEVSRALAELAWQLARTAGELRAALADLRAPSGDDEGADQLRVPVWAETEGPPAQHVVLAPEPRDGGGDLEREAPCTMGRRSGVDRRAGERRRAQPEGLAARVFRAIERRSGTERRSGAERRAGDRVSLDR